jgi:bacterioferritin (cytochrome b1)
MSLTEWFWSNPRSRAIDRIGSLAARYDALAANIERHAAICRLPTIRASLEELAATEKAHAQALDGLLIGEGRRRMIRQAPLIDGSSNWQRLQADLALQAKLLSELNQAIVLLEGHDHHAAARLREIATEEENNLGELRDLVLRCDTQALD